MNSTTLMMLSRALETERRREIERRPHRFVEPEVQQPRERRFGSLRWIRLPGLTGSQA